MYKYTDDIFSIPGSFANGVKEQTSPRIVAKSVEQVPLSKIVIPKEEKVLLIKVPAYCERNEARNEMPSRKTMSAAESSAAQESESSAESQESSAESAPENSEETSAQQ